MKDAERRAKLEEEYRQAEEAWIAEWDSLQRALLALSEPRNRNTCQRTRHIG